MIWSYNLRSHLLSTILRRIPILTTLVLVYIQMGLTIRYTVQTLNFYNSHSFFNVRLICCFSFENTNYFNIHTHNRRGEKVLKKLTVMYIQKDLTLQTFDWLSRHIVYYLYMYGYVWLFGSIINTLMHVS